LQCPQSIGSYVNIPKHDMGLAAHLGCLQSDNIENGAIGGA
jgi:hypothetical protein